LSCDAQSFGLQIGAGFGSTNHIVDSQSGFNAMAGGALAVSRLFPGAATLDRCVSLTNSLRAQLIGIGCTAEPLVIQDSGGGSGSIRSSFVCEGGGAAMVHVIGEVHRSVLNITP
jgi:hypothetical protein